MELSALAGTGCVQPSLHAVAVAGPADSNDLEPTGQPAAARRLAQRAFADVTQFPGHPALAPWKFRALILAFVDHQARGVGCDPLLRRGLLS